MKEATLKVFEEFETIPWFKNCGSLAPSDEISLVEKRSEAVKSVKSLKWRCFTNAVYNRWMDLAWGKKLISEGKENETLALINKTVDRFLEENRSRIFDSFGYDQGVEDELRGAFAMIAFEVETADLFPPLFHYPVLYPWYKRGHLPCGWDGKQISEMWSGNGPEDLPKGRLKVY